MQKKSLLILATVVALSAIMVISAATIYSLNFTMNANVAQAGTVTITVNNTNYTNGQALTLDWGTVTSGQNTVSIKIYNNVNAPVTPSIGTTNLPTDWTLNLSDVSSIPANGVVTRTLVLTVPANPTAGPYTWSAILNVSS